MLMTSPRCSLSPDHEEKRRHDRRTANLCPTRGQFGAGACGSAAERSQIFVDAPARPRGNLAQVEALAKAAVDDLAAKLGDPAKDDTVFGPIANRAQYDRVQAMIAAGIADGAKLICGGLGLPDGLTQGFFSRLTIFSDVTSDMRIAQEEIFGPVLSILPYDDVDQAVAIANDTVFGLGGHLQGTDMEQVRSVARQIRTGQVHINYPTWDPHAPFGGYKRSGNGREYGAFGFEEYLEIKSILGFA